MRCEPQPVYVDKTNTALLVLKEWRLKRGAPIERSRSIRLNSLIPLVPPVDSILLEGSDL